MGCGTSRVHPKRKTSDRERDDEQNFKLSSCKLTFSPRQILRLNKKFATLLEIDNNAPSEKTKENQRAFIEVIVERLIQRLVCEVGRLDSRFSSKFLIDLDPLKNYSYEPRKRLKCKYLVRLDVVSTPGLYPEFFEPPVRAVESLHDDSVPRGYARIKVHGEFLERWIGFISPNGFLRRDKIQERFVELLARAAARPSETFCPKEVDESALCGSPGKIVDPITLHHVLTRPPSHRMFFGSAECNELRFPDPRDFRIAIVQGAPETRLHLSFLSPTARSVSAEDVEISITLGIGVAGWPSGTDFPSRLPLDHVDVILGYRAAQLDYYLVPKGPHRSVRCEDRSSIWEIRTYATEMFLEHHYSPTSVVFRVYKILLFLLEILKARGVKTVNRYILKNLLFFELEQRKEIRNWAPKMISRRVLSILDRLLDSLRKQIAPGYIFTSRNLLLDDDIVEDDYVSDGEILDRYLKQLYDEGLVKWDSGETESVFAKDRMENVLIEKWENVVANMLPPASNRSTRLSAVNNSPATVSYTRQQMEYVAFLIREILKLRTIQRKILSRDLSKDFPIEEPEPLKNKEDFIYLLEIMFDQAKQKLIGSSERSSRTRTGKSFESERILQSYDISTAMLIDEIRRTEKYDCGGIEDDASIVVRIMKCLYEAIDSDGRILGPVLRPYLNQIFRGSHKNCWFLPDWKKMTDLSEFEAIGAFSSLVLSGSINPLDGILNSAEKGWSWANVCLRILRADKMNNSARIILGEKMEETDSGIRIFFCPCPGKTIRFNVSIADKHPFEKARKKESGEISGTDARHATIRSFQDVLDSAISSEQAGAVEVSDEEEDGLRPPKSSNRLGRPPHARMRDGNPFVVASLELRRRGNHRGLGSIVQALISLRKLTILQEISQYLPENERTRVLSDIKKLSKEVQRLTVENYRKRKNFSLSSGKNRFSFKRSGKTSPNRFVRQKRSSEACLGAPDRSRSKEIYRSVNEFSVLEKEDREKESKKSGKRRGADRQADADDSLLGTCRELRRRREGIVSRTGYRSETTRYKNGSSSFPKSFVKIPFCIKASSCDSVTRLEQTRI